MSSSSKNEQDKNADTAIKAMITAAVGGAVIPAHVNWAFMAAVLGGGVVSIGLCYGVQLTKEEGWKLVQQFFVAAGTWFVALNFGSKFITMILQTTGVGYGIGYALDAAVSAAASYAIGQAAKEYFKGQRDMGKIGKIFRESFTNFKKGNS
jgi:hypothetical protein